MVSREEQLHFIGFTLSVLVSHDTDHLTGKKADGYFVTTANDLELHLSGWAQE